METNKKIDNLTMVFLTRKSKSVESILLVLFTVFVLSCAAVFEQKNGTASQAADEIVASSKFSFVPRFESFLLISHLTPGPFSVCDSPFPWGTIGR